MPDSGENIRFQVLVNGADQCTVGIESIGVLSVILNWVRRDLSEAPKEMRDDPEFDTADWIHDRTEIRAGGLDSAANEHVEWFSSYLDIGDEITVRVLPGGKFEPPSHRY